MKTQKWWILIVFLCCSSLKVQCSSQNELDEAETLLHQTLDALKRTLNFFSFAHKKINLDAVIGTRIVDGILKVLLHHIDNDIEFWPLSDATIQSIRDLQKQAALVSDQSISYVQNTDPSYYKRIGTLAQKDFWTVDFASKDFQPENFYRAWLPKKGESMREAESDSCIMELFGTGNNAHTKCQISAQCWNTMTAIGYSGYSLTHEAFYLLIAYKMGCIEEMNKHQTLLDQPPPSELISQFCASMYLEAKEIEQKNYTKLKQDLFMEQAVLCGIMGYRWFFSPDWLEVILSWQDKQTGCYKGEFVRESEIESYHKDAHNGRNILVKREERILDDGCLCHRTAVAAGALAAYVRYIAEYLQMTFERNQFWE